MQDEPELHERLWANTRRFKARAARGSASTPGQSETPITPGHDGRPRDRDPVQPTGCSSEGVFAQPVVFPTVALDQARIRTIVTAAHTRRAARPGARRRSTRSGASWASSRGDAGHDRGPAPTRADATRPARRRDLPLDAHLHTDLSPDSDVPIDAYAGLAVERGHRRARDHRPRRLRPRRRPPTASRRSRDRERDVREAAERWADRGRRDPVRRRDHLRARATRTRSGTTSAPPARLRHRQRPHQRGLAVQGVATSRPGSRGRSLRGDRGALLRRGDRRRPGPGCSTRIGHLDFVKRYLVPHVTAGRPRRGARSCTSRPARARRDRHGAGGQRLRPAPAAARDVPAPPIVARYRELGGTARDHWLATPTERSGSHMGSGEAYRAVAGAGYRGAGVPPRGSTGRVP